MVKFGIAGAGALEDKDAFKEWIFNAILMYSDESGTSECISDMSDGAGIVMAEVAIENGYDLVCVYPFKAEHRDDIKALEEHAAAIIYLAQEMMTDGATMRNNYVVDSCDVLLANWDGRTYGKVYNMIERAHAQDKMVIVWAN
jgi:hypothetical protein